MNSPHVRLVTPITWSAALLPDLEAAGADVSVYPSLDELVDRTEASADDIERGFVMFVVYVDTANAVCIGDWWGRQNASSTRDHVLVVVGEGGLRYEWQLRELGAVHVIGSVASAGQVVRLAQKWLRQFPPTEEKWPAWIHAKTAEWSGT